ncbi:MAG: macro domain-containing protein [Spirochaetales bacterium]|jgi:O-acetyl-ADP-ribose deacetylase (regulator of RNase III)|nr:macro domain-containing protein [Spirochaetales bacterium]
MMDIQIYLRDKNEKMVQAWLEEFKNYSNVEISCGNIFDIKADAIISPANSFGFMDGGIDLVYSGYFGGEIQKSLQNKIISDFNGELPVGRAAIIETKNNTIKYLVSCPTMRVPEIISNTVNAYLAFRAGLIEIINFNQTKSEKISSILCPGLGTLTGNISAKTCAKQMRYAYDAIICNKYNFPNELFTAYNQHQMLK